MSKKKSVQKPKNIKKTLLRIFSYMAKRRLLLILVILFVFISSGATVAGTYFLKPIINQGIVPLIGKPLTPGALLPFIQMLLLMGGIYLAGAACAYAYNRMMIVISNGTLNAVRRDLFNSMEDLPIKYFDTHTHGELMSRYTNDVDTLREAIAMSLPQMLTATVTVAVGLFLIVVYGPADPEPPADPHRHRHACDHVLCDKNRGQPKRKGLQSTTESAWRNQWLY